jgi:serine/threonine-protein kinase ATR
VEAALISGKWERLDRYLDMCSKENIGDFNIGIGMALRALRKGNREIFQKTIDELRHKVANSLSVNAVSSLQSCHDALLQLHALAEVEVIVNSGVENAGDYGGVTQNLDRRLDVMGVYISENQYLLGLRRAAMELSSSFTESDIAACWLKSARLAQKNNCAGQAYHHVLRAAQLGDKSATIEHARLLWKDGHHSKAIHMLKGAIAANAFVAHDTHNPDIDSITIPQTRERYQNTLTAKVTIIPLY